MSLTLRTAAPHTSPGNSASPHIIPFALLSSFIAQQLCLMHPIVLHRDGFQLVFHFSLDTLTQSPYTIHDVTSPSLCLTDIQHTLLFPALAVTTPLPAFVGEGNHEQRCTHIHTHAHTQISPSPAVLRTHMHTHTRSCSDADPSSTAYRSWQDIIDEYHWSPTHAVPVCFLSQHLRSILVHHPCRH